MPIGIPDAPIDFTQDAPERPSDWSEEVPGYYYVDMTNGSTAQTYGSETLPRKYLPKPIPAGSYVEVAGSYSNASGGVIQIYAEGTDEAWVANTSGPAWITSAPDTSNVFTDHKIVFWGENAFLTDVIAEEGSSIQVGSMAEGYAAKNMVVRNCEVIGQLTSTGGNILLASGNENSTTENVVFYNNVGHDTGDITSEDDIDTGVMAVTGYCSKIWILENTGYNAAGSGLQINASQPAVACQNVYAGNNEFYDVRQSGMWVKFAINVVFSSNYIHDIISTSWSPAKGMGSQYEPHGLWMINNHIHGVEYGVRIASTYSTDDDKKIYIIGNVIHDVASVQSPDDVGGTNSWQSAGIHIVGGQYHYIYNNLIYDAPNGIDFSSQGEHTYVSNNMIFDLSSGHDEGEYGRAIWTEYQTLDEAIFISNNYFDENVFVQLKTVRYYGTEAIDALGDDNNNIMGTQFISDSDVTAILSAESSEGYDFSEVLDLGTDVDDILSTEFNAAIPLIPSINKDILNKVRNQGASIDIGPFEQGGEEVAPATTLAFLQVNNGDGDGYYQPNSNVTVEAEDAADGYEFDIWTGDVDSLAETSSATTTITVADEDLTITANYKALPVTQYTLVVNDGTGGGDYDEGSVVSISADTAPEGQVFEAWTGDIDTVADSTSATTTITIEADATVTATYQDEADALYNLVVNNGSGDGSYTSGSIVTITADTASDDQVFDAWTGDITNLTDSSSATTTVTIGEANVTVTATYVDFVEEDSTIMVEKISTPFVIDLAGREFWTFNAPLDEESGDVDENINLDEVDVHGNLDGADQAIDEPVFTTGEGSKSFVVSTDVQFVQDDVQQGNGYIKMKYNEANSCVIPLVGNGQEQTAKIYIRMGVWTDDDATFTVSAGDEIEVIEMPSHYAHLRFEVRVKFTESVNVTIHPDGEFVGYSAFCVAGVVLDTLSTASDSATDSDSDGIPDEWETLNDLDSSDDTDALSDPDQDGISNLDEYIAGTDPKDAQSFLSVEQVTHTDESFTLKFQSQSGREYSIGRKYDLQDEEWEILDSVISGTGDIIEVEDDATEPAQFYRLNVTVSE
jgi:hypothetical protein